LPTEANIAEVKKHGQNRILDMIFVSIWHGGDPPDTATHNINITHPGKGSTAESNIRWNYYNDDNKNMLYAYGGADLNVKGTVYTMQMLEVFLGIFTIKGEWAWTGNVNVRIGDLYAFESTSSIKTTGSSLMSDPYAAALWLERNCAYKPFYHEMSFELLWGGLKQPDIWWEMFRAENTRKPAG